MGKIISYCCGAEKKTELNPTPTTTANPTPSQNPLANTNNQFKIRQQGSAPSFNSSTLIDSSKRNERSQRGTQHYQSVKYLGKGSFGCVVQAQQKETGRRFAMKIIQKSKIKQFNLLQCQLIKQMSHYDFLVGIKQTFQNKTHIYVIMEYLPMGDLCFYLRKKEVLFSEQIVRVIIAEIVVGIGILHKSGIVYRQLKPENILITDQGHIKLTDYGLSKIIIEQRQSISTFIGALEYMAPEALNGDFGQKADIWALGILMYELMFKENPLQNEVKRQNAIQLAATQKNIIEQKINSRIGYMSSNFRDLLLKLVEVEPQKRISLEDIRVHQFFRSINWGQIERRENQPPLKQLVQKHDYIKFRDAAAEQYIRKEVIKHKNLNDNYQLNLYEFRNSQ